MTFPRFRGDSNFQGEGIVKIAIVGGCGHVGLPLSVSLAKAGLTVAAYDIDENAVTRTNSGNAPFFEPGLDVALAEVVGRSFRATTEASVIAEAEIVIMIVGTPLDVHLNPDPNTVVEAVRNISSLMNNNQLLILRSTVFPGVTKRVESLLGELGLETSVVFCPERIAEGVAMRELSELPQIVGARNSSDANRACEIFLSLGIETVVTSPEEAELAKLFTNTWRYIKFAAANQFWMMANDAGVNYENVRNAIRYEYPRAADLPGAGFAAGPCLFKDTMQLAAHSGNNFALGQAAMLVNEGQPNYIVEKLKDKYDLTNLRVGILGMAFKGESDDPRSSLAYKLKRILKFNCLEVLTSDPFVKNDPNLLSFEEVLMKSDILIIGAPHKKYIDFTSEKPIIDIWNVRGNGSSV